MNEQADIAVLLPVYYKDKPKWFRESLKSVLDQTGVLFDVFILCDGKLSKELHYFISEQKKKNKNVKVFWFKQNRGLPFVLNDGLKYGFKNGYKFFFRTDADDICMPGRFERQYKFMLNNPETDVVGSAIEEINETGKSRGKTVIYPKSHEDCFRFYKKRAPMAHPAVLFRKRFFEKSGLYSQRHIVQQDTYLWYQGFKNKARFANIPEVMLKYRIPNNFFSSKRSGFKRAKALLKDRLKINKDLKYGITADIYAVIFFFLTISPKFVKKIAYKLFR